MSPRQRRGEIFELRRNGRAVGYLTRTQPPAAPKPNWKAHFDWLKAQPPQTDAAVLSEFDEQRQRQRARDQALENLQ